METSSNSASDLAADFPAPQPPNMASIVPVPPSHAHTAELINQIAALSASIFPGPVNFEMANDPESPSDEYLVFDVVAAGEYAEYRDRIFQWYEEVERLVPGAIGEFRLIVHPKR